jgi:hypothetical protein
VRTLIAAGAVAVGTAAAALGMGLGHANPGTNNTMNVVGEPYAKAVAILRAQGVKAVFGGSVGSDVPQAQCVVASQKVLTTAYKMQLNLDCTAAAQPQRPAAPSAAGVPGAQGTEGAARPTPGAPGVVTVVPTPVG